MPCWHSPIALAQACVLFSWQTQPSSIAPSQSLSSPSKHTSTPPTSSTSPSQSSSTPFLHTSSVGVQSLSTQCAATDCAGSENTAQWFATLRIPLFRLLPLALFR